MNCSATVTTQSDLNYYDNCLPCQNISTSDGPRRHYISHTTIKIFPIRFQRKYYTNHHRVGSIHICKSRGLNISIFEVHPLTTTGWLPIVLLCYFNLKIIRGILNLKKPGPYQLVSVSTGNYKLGWKQTLDR